jgi:hypothetical protein
MQMRPAFTYASVYSLELRSRFYSQRYILSQWGQNFLDSHLILYSSRISRDILELLFHVCKYFASPVQKYFLQTYLRLQAAISIKHEIFKIHKYRRRAIISQDLYIFYPILENNFFVFKEVFKENSVLMYG